MKANINRKVGYYEYDPVIYPRKLWVAIGQQIEDLQKTFVRVDGAKWMPDRSDYDGLTVGEMMRCDDNSIGELVIFDTRKSMTMNVCAHEAFHVCDAIEDAIGMEHGDEASAYLIGWIASCINKACLGVGEFVEIKGEK